MRKTNEMKPKISAEMTIGEILQKRPDAAQILMQFGMHCLGCAVASSEDLQTAARAHQIDLEPLLKALNDENPQP